MNNRGILMRHAVRLPIGLALAIPLTLFLAVSGVLAGTLEGHWVLVEQNYGKGKANFAPLDAPVHLEFVMEGAEMAGKVWQGESRASAAAWPAFDAGGGLLPLQMERRRIDPLAGVARAEYMVQPSPPDGVILEVVEEYRLTDKGDALVGTTTVSFVRDGEPRGSYVLHRRFERRP
jgi:hypothetical protein